MTEEEAAVLVAIASLMDACADMVDALCLRGDGAEAVPAALAALELSLADPLVREAVRVVQAHGGTVPAFRGDVLQ
jgi:hypothetical protein